MHDFADIYDFLIIRRAQWFQTPIAPKRVTSFQNICIYVSVMGQLYIATNDVFYSYSLGTYSKSPVDV